MGVWGGGGCKGWLEGCLRESKKDVGGVVGEAGSLRGKFRRAGLVECLDGWMIEEDNQGDFIPSVYIALSCNIQNYFSGPIVKVPTIPNIAYTSRGFDVIRPCDQCRQFR